MKNSWQKVKLGEILTERTEKPDINTILSGEIPIVAKIGFDSGMIQLREQAQTKTNMILIKPGDLVISGINVEKGSVAIYSGENKKPAAATIHYSSYGIKKEKVDPAYLWYFLRCHVFKSILANNLPNGIKTEVKPKRFLPIEILLPSLDEQQRIVRKIEEMAEKIDEARGLRQEAITRNEAIIAVAITKAVSKVSLDGNLGSVLVEKPRNGRSVHCDNAEDGIPVLALGAVTGFRYRETEFKQASEPIPSSAYYWLRKGDLLITRSNSPELVGHAAIYNGSPHPCIYPDLMMRLVVNEERACKRFVHYWLQSIPVREFIRKTAKGTSPTMKKISQGVVMNIPFPTQISIHEQQNTVDSLEALEAKVDAVRRLQSETAAELNALLPSILDKAFKGEL